MSPSQGLGTAEADLDYAGLPVPVFFSAGTMDGGVSYAQFSIIDDNSVEDDEFLYLVLGCDYDTHEVTIVDNDVPPQVVSFHYNTDLPDGDIVLNRLNNIAVTFDRTMAPWSVDKNDLTLRNTTTDTTVSLPDLPVVWDTSYTTATWDLTGAIIQSGWHEVRVHGSGIWDIFGNYLDGDGDGEEQGDKITTRFVKPPYVEQVKFNTDLAGGDQLFDTLISASFTFDRVMDEDSFQVGDLVIWNLTTDAQVVLPPSTSTVTWDAETRTATWEFPDATVDFGWHEVQLLGDSIADLSGNLLDGDEDDLAGGDYVLPGDRVVTYAGDTDLDGDVDIDDMLLVSGNFTGPGEFSMTWADGDFDGDGDIDVDDLLVAAGNYNGPGGGWGQTLWEGAAAPGSLAGDVLTTEVLDSMAEAAVGRWLAAGLESSLAQMLSAVHFVILDLPDAYLGFAVGNIIFIDVDAAGFGWYIDTTPDDDDEFSLSSDWGLEAESGSAAAGKVDLLTVLAHEFGHILGLEHDEESISGLMSEWLRLGIRRADYEDAVDVLLAGEHWWEEEAA